MKIKTKMWDRKVRYGPSIHKPDPALVRTDAQPFVARNEDGGWSNSGVWHRGYPGAE